MKKTIFISSLLLSVTAYSNGSTPHYQKAVFAGGCFWCLESDFQYMQNHVDLSHGGIKKVVSGYDGGTKKNPNYRAVSAGITNYKESVEIIYNPDKISYKELVEYFYRRIDPTDNKGQFCDKGKQYQSAIYYINESQQKIAEEVTSKLKEVFTKVDKPVYTQILPSTKFYDAEKYHQNYHHKNPKRYCYYRTGCGRDVKINRVWQDIDWQYNKVVPFNIPSSYAACLSR